MTDNKNAMKHRKDLADSTTHLEHISDIELIELHECLEEALETDDLTSTDRKTTEKAASVVYDAMYARNLLSKREMAWMTNLIEVKRLGMKGIPKGSKLHRWLLAQRRIAHSTAKEVTV